jgi:hypothetical protein
LHPFANERRKISEAKDAVRARANDHAAVADLGHDSCAGQPTLEPGTLYGR